MMFNRKEYEMLYKLSAELGTNFNKTFQSAQNTLKAAQKEIDALNKAQSNISAYQKQQSAVDATKNKLRALQQQYDNIQKEIKETGEFSSTLENKLISKRQQIDKTSSSLEKQTQKLSEMDAALREAGVDTGNLEKESARLGTQIDALKDKQEKAAEEAENFGDSSVDAFEAVGQAIAAAGVAAALKEIYEAYMECVNIAGDLQAAMSNVEALSGATTAEMSELNDMAKDLGATTKFTAQESADAMGYMAMAGWDVNDMLSGMDGVLQLAAASGEDLAMVSDIVTDSLSAFGLTAADTAHFSDVLAAAATNSNTNVSIMGETFKMSASVAGALGYSIEDVATAVGLMANSGVKGSIAGTALKNTFNGLLEGVTLTSSAFGEYEYSAVKADGTMKSFGSTIKELRGYFEQMTEAERVSNAMTIAGQRGYNGLLAILNATEEDYSSLTATIENCSGAAAKMAAIKMDNMVGQLTLAQSAWDALKVTVGEQFTPTMTEVYKVSADVFNELNAFVQANPALIKSVAAFVGVLGTATVGLTAFAAAKKAAAAINLASLFASAGPILLGVAAVAGLTASVVAFVSEADDTVPTVEELTAATQAMDEAMAEADASFADASTQALATAQVADDYITRLEEIEAATGGAVAGNQEYKDVLTLLSQAVPELAGSIDLTTNSIDGGTAALRENTDALMENAKAQAYQDYMNSLLDDYNDVMVEAAENEIKLTEAQIKSESASKKMQDTFGKLLTTLGMTEEEFKKTYGTVANIPFESVAGDVAVLRDEYLGYEKQLNEANKTQRNLTAAIEEDNAAVAEAEEVIDNAKDAYYRLTGQTKEQVAADAEAAAQASELNGIIGNTAEQIATLTEAYNEAYTAAYSSISGQYDLWDKAANVVATSAGTINSALESQITYWQDYNANLQNLTDRSDDIEGLGDMIASFADGSEDSVNAIAGMAGATDAQLAAMVANWKAVQEEYAATSESLAALAVDLPGQTAEIQKNLEEAVKDMDLGEEAAESGTATIQGYIDAAKDMLPKVQEVYGNLGQAAVDAINAAGGTSLTVSFSNLDHYASGTQSASPGMALVGEEGPELVYFGGGEQVLTAAETAALSAIGASPAAPAASMGDTGGDIILSVAPVYSITGAVNAAELEGVLRSHDEELRDFVLAIVAEASVDAARRAYR